MGSSIIVYCIKGKLSTPMTLSLLILLTGLRYSSSIFLSLKKKGVTIRFLVRERCHKTTKIYCHTYGE